MKRRERGQLIERGPQRWLLRVFQGRLNGRRTYYSRAVTGTKREAERSLTSLLGELDAGALTSKKPEPAEMTLGAWLEDWLSKRLSISRRTLHDYRMRLEADVIPVMGNLKLSEVTTSRIEEVYREMAKTHAPTTLRYTHVVLRAALQAAVERGLIQKNPAAAKIERPKIRRRPISVLTPEQIQLVFKDATDDPLYALWCLLLGTGFRPGEALAFRWEDLVHEGDTWSLIIQRTLVSDGHGRYQIMEHQAKTESSLRKTALPAVVVKALERHRAQQHDVSKVKGVSTDYIFASAAGTPIDPAKVRARFKSLLRRLGLPPIRLYDCRHSHATALITQGVPIEFVANRLGHRSTFTAQKHYVKYLPRTQQVAVEAFDALVSGDQ